MLGVIISGFPWTVLKREQLPRKVVVSRPSAQTLRFGALRAGIRSKSLDDFFLLQSMKSVDRAAVKRLSDADVYIALSGTGARSGALAKKWGKVYICDRGSSHILFQERILNEERKRVGLPIRCFSRGVVERELLEYARADAITVPSSFARDSFVSEGVSADKINVIPYGVNLSNFFKVASPSINHFNVGFVGSLSIRKGLGDLIEAFGRLKVPNKTLTLVGTRGEGFETFAPRLQDEGIRILGPVPNSNLPAVISDFHVLVLPSIEEGFGLVLAEAMACGVPTISTTNTGGRDLITDGKEGFIVPIRSPELLHDRLALLFENSTLRNSMSESALARVRSIGGWDDYGNRYAALIRSLI